MTPVQTSATRLGAGASYPREHIPKNPILSAASFTRYSRTDIPSVLDAGAVRYVNRGCMAIGLALQHANIGADDEVLLPAYHCITMIEPVAWRGARSVFYRVRADTSIDLDDVESRLTPHTRVLLVTHYFGFPQDMPRIRKFCDAHRVLLIEDCSHAFFGRIGAAPIGSFGDYATASAWKFLPIYDGGVLISARRNLADLQLEARGPWFQAKAFVNTLEQAFDYERLGVARLLLKLPLMLKDRLLRRAKKPAVAAASLSSSGLSTSLGGWGFNAALVSTKMSLSSWLITRLASKSRNTQSRRRNYTRLLAELGNLPGCRPLFATLPDGVVPQVFPLVFDAPERAFPLLKQAGVPIIRFGEYLWEGMDLATCPVSAELSRGVFQFPCHQELSASELEWMIGRIKAVSVQ